MSAAAPRWLRRAGRLALSASARQDARHELRRRVRGEPALPPGDLRRVLVVCHGNICRSPFAAVLLAQSALDLDVRSAGLHAAKGDRAYPAAAAGAARLGVSLDMHRSTPVSAEGLADRDLILVMQGAHTAEIARRWRDALPRVRLLGDFLPEPPHLLPDPWGQSDAVFDAVFARVKSAVDHLAKRIEASCG